MKADIHPDYHDVIFEDTSCGFRFLSKSTMKPKETVVWEDGKEYPVIKVGVSSASHVFYTGKKKSVSAEGRAERFNKKYGLKTEED